MAYNKAASENQARWTYWICTKCKSRVHPERRYCACHTDVYGGTLYYSVSDEPPKMLGRVNLALPYFTYNDCKNYKDCDYCASFGVINKNPYGFGGLDCGYRTDSARCRCCKTQIECFLEIENPDIAIKKGVLKTLDALTQGVSREAA